MLVVAAIGGNAMLRRGEEMTPDNQRANIRKAAASLAAIVRAGHRLVVTHGNGPQIGMLAMNDKDHWPLDLLGAETDGMIGFVIEQELENALHHSHPVATILTQVIVNPHDPAFKAPTKFVGPLWSEEGAKAIAGPRGWTIAEDGKGWRRVVASPAPVSIPDIRAVQLLVDNDVIVICGGGGGIPIVRNEDGSFRSVEAVIDKDYASALLATSLKADALLLLTDVDAVYRDFGTDKAAPIREITVDEATSLDVPAGSMRPKVLAACDFAKTGGIAGIGQLEDAVAVLNGTAGSRIIF